MDGNPTTVGMPLHTRSLTVTVSRTSESTWHARGDVIDLRKNGFVPSNYDLQPSGVIHMMSIDFDFDPKTLIIESIEIAQPFVAIESSEATKGECCRDPAPKLLALNGECLDTVFTKKLGGVFGGALGCSHLLTLFQLMASAVPRAVVLEYDRIAREGTEHPLGARFYRRAVFVDGNQRSGEQTDVAVQLADTHTRPLEGGARVTERLSLSHEVKTFATIDRKRFLVDRLEIRERERTYSTVGTATWTDHTEWAEPLLGVRLIPGMAGRIFKLIGDRGDLQAVRDNLLQMAPGFLQITAAQMDEYFERREQTQPGETPEKPAVSDLGGNSDSCYMWRRDGAIHSAWFAGTAIGGPGTRSRSGDA